MFLKKGEISRRGNEKRKGRVFQIVVRDRRKFPTEGGTGIKNFTMGGFLLGEGNLRRSDFDDSNLFQS